MNKTFVILVNNAYKMGKYHLALAHRLKEEGGNVILVFTDRLPFYTENIDTSDFKYYIFSDFFKNNFNNTQIKEKYKNININKTFYSEYDRDIVFSKIKFKGNDYYQKLMANLINFFDRIFYDNNVDFSIYESISNSFAYIAYEIGLINNIQYCGYAGSRFKNSFELYSEEFCSKNKIEKKFNSTTITNISEDELKIIDDYLLQYTNEKIPSYHPRKTTLDWNFSILKKYFQRDKIKILIGSILFSIKEFKNIPFCYQVNNPLKEIIRGFIRQLKRRYRTIISKKYFEKPNFTESFYLYPQQFKPEASTSVLARHYCNDISIIENIAFNLPFGTFLYVKEHFVNYGRLSTKYYQALKNIPNVKLIWCEENTKKLIDNSLGVITLTSTVGFEALLSNKPVFVFGEVFYECHPNCHKIISFNEIEKEIKDLSIDMNRDTNRRFIYAYRKNTYPGNIYYSIGTSEYKTEDFTEPFINAIYECFFKKST